MNSKYTLLSMAMAIPPWGIPFGFVGLIIQLLGLLAMVIITALGKWMDV
jgi:hypothetical protein